MNRFKRVIAILLVVLLFVSFLGITTSASRDFSVETELAYCLKSLGLFKGVSENDFALDRSLTRVEAVVMLIRLLGKEQETLNSHYSHPFTDVPKWANDYIGYAYTTGLTNGISDHEFGTSDASAAMYLTFVLRALGYSDNNQLDFSWANPFPLARDVGILPEIVNTTDFLRADAVTISYTSLAAKMKNSSEELSGKLISAGVFTKEQFDQIYNEALFGSKTDTSLSAEEVFSKCSPGVFCIITYDTNDLPYSLGSGFFVTADGIAITNYHVLEDSAKACVVLEDDSVFDVTHVLYYDAEKDYAVIKVGGYGFATLSVGDANRITTGETIYAIGNPEGLMNTISSGIISNTSRSDYNGWIQITAPISHGSSGGALLSTKGEVIGITTAAITSGQNLNFAVPINTVVSTGGVPLLSLHSMQTYYEFATACGFINSSEPLSRQEQAYNALKDWVINNYNDMMDGIDREYIDTQSYDDGSSDTVGVILHDSEGADSESIILYYSYCYKSGSIDYAFLFLYKDTQSYFAYYGYYPDEEATEELFTGSATIYAPSFSGDKNIVFESTSGIYPSSDPKMLYFAMLSFTSSLQFTEQLFKNHVTPYGEYSISDFGFNPYALYVPKLEDDGGGDYNQDQMPAYENPGWWYFPFFLYSYDGKVYLGKLVTDKYDEDSIWNEYGTYGSKYSDESIWNEYGTYGSKYSDESAFNKYATEPPMIVDYYGTFVGYLTTNTYFDDGYTITEIRQFLLDNDQ